MSAEALVGAIQNKDLATVRSILSEDPTLASAKGPGGLSMLQFALYLRAGRIAEALLDASAPVTITEAAILGEAQRLVKLLDEDPSRVAALSPDGAPPLHFAAHFGHPEAVKLLLARGASSATMAGPPFANTALHAAAAGGAAECVKVLLAAGAAVDARDKEGNTALHVAAANGSVESVEALLAAGADRNARNDAGRTPWDEAAAREQEEVLALLEPGAPAKGT